jgi:hypothetical protein
MTAVLRHSVMWKLAKNVLSESLSLWERVPTGG